MSTEKCFNDYLRDKEFAERSGYDGRGSGGIREESWSKKETYSRDVSLEIRSSLILRLFSESL